VTTRNKNPGLNRVLATGFSALFMFCFGISVQASWNNPYPDRESGSNTLYTSFSVKPKRMDPARSYSENEYDVIGNIYEPPFEYHYLKRPYELMPSTATAIPKPVYYDSKQRRLADPVSPDRIAYSVYRIEIKKGILFQPHPALARDDAGQYRYHNLDRDKLEGIFQLRQFEHQGTRELTAADYVYQIKRLASPRLHSPIYSLMAEYIVGLRELMEELTKADQQYKDIKDKPFLDLRKHDIKGVKLVDDHTYEITIKGKYPQFIYWMAMQFFAPMPWEADLFFSQPGMDERNLTLDWYSIGTGAYMLTVNDPNRQMVLERNPNFRGELYPSEGEEADKTGGLLNDAGGKMPFIDKIIFSLEKEGIPYWNKFLQGYYDQSGVSAESFDQAVQFNATGDTDVTPEMRDKGIELLAVVRSTTSYLGFNMLDPVIGGYSDRARKLRQAISIAIDYEEEVSIFRNGRGIAAQSLLPPGIFGYQEGEAGINPYVYDWVDGKPKRKSIDEARRILKQAGYENGVDPKTGQRLLLYLDERAAGPEQKARFDWMRKQFEKLNIQLVVRATDYNRFQDKMRDGSSQIFSWGWNADYPDPENFLFLLYGPNGKVKFHGENAANYDSPEFNRLFEQVKDMDNGPARQKIMDRIQEVLRRDAPWAWGYHPKKFVLQHDWVRNHKLHLMSHNTFKYMRVDAELREQRRHDWNKPVWWPVVLTLLAVLAGIVPAIVLYRRKERQVRA